ncbi:glycosyltransferase 87 family protein [Spirillospora sp. CA-294931]|uniref:glycosyltransferase 87 family protein n=1 Tax=Spirillospora sp. CA-294931 TaxID=3240042 RepID=UPI003D913CB5
MNRLWRRVAACLPFALFAALACRETVSALRRPLPGRQADLHIYVGSVQTVVDGRPLYDYAAEDGGPFTYPPFALLVLLPVGWPPEQVVRAVWTVATCLAVALIAVLLTWRVRSRRLAVTGGAATVLLLAAPSQSNLRLGQVSVFIVLLVLADALEITPPRWRGTLIGLAAAIKLTPLLFVPYLLVTGQYRAALRAGCVFAAAAALALVALPGDSMRFWTDAVFTTSRIGDLAFDGNQSVQGVLLRYGSLDPELSSAWLLYVAVSTVGALLWARELRAEGRVTEAVVVVGCATIAASPVSWTHHQFWTVLAGLVLVSRGGPARRFAGVVVLVAMAFPLGAPGAAGFLADNARALCAAVICWAGWWAITQSGQREDRAGYGYDHA